MAAVKLAEQDIFHQIKSTLFVFVFFKILCHLVTMKITTKT